MSTSKRQGTYLTVPHPRSGCVLAVGGMRGLGLPASAGRTTCAGLARRC